MHYNDVSSAFWSQCSWHKGSDAIEWFLANMDGVTTVEKAQVRFYCYRKTVLYVHIADWTTIIEVWINYKYE